MLLPNMIIVHLAKTLVLYRLVKLNTVFTVSHIYTIHKPYSKFTINFTVSYFMTFDFINLHMYIQRGGSVYKCLASIK